MTLAERNVALRRTVLWRFEREHLQFIVHSVRVTSNHASENGRH